MADLRVLVVDDDLDHAVMVVEFLRLTPACQAADIDTAATYDSAATMLGGGAYDLAFVDYWLGARDGLSLLREIRQQGIDTPVVVLTGRGAEEVAVDAMKAGAADYLSKTQLSVETLDRAVRHAVALHVEEQQRRQAEAALRASEERFRALVENSSDTLLLVDREARVQYVSPSSQRYLGWRPDEMIGRSILDLLDPDDRDLVVDRMSDTLRTPGQPVTAELRFRHADGTFRIMESVAVNHFASPSVRAIVVNARDITERRRLENQLRESQKMEAVGQLAGGVAHDFNNLLTAILGYCHLLLEDADPETQLGRDLEEIRSAGERAAAITRQLLAFSRRQILQPQIVDLNALIQQLDKLLKGLVGAAVELVPALAADLPPIMVDPGTIEQILVSVIVNARDAMPHGGRLTLETADTHVDASMAALLDGTIPEGRYVVLAISDSGQGMDAATRARIFEPFFTTKELGQGSGLGLATVYGLVTQSGGYVTVDSTPGSGTTFKVFLPPADQIVTESAPPRRNHLGRRPGWETILLVEDEDAVRSLARMVLRRQGYTVLEARHGLDALRLAERHRDPIHLMITDVVMPHMDGRALAERLSSARPDMKVLFMSAYTDHAVISSTLATGSSFLQKPFTPAALARRVRLLLDRVAESGGEAAER